MGLIENTSLSGGRTTTTVNKNNFLSILNRAIGYRAGQKTALCRCADCYSEKQKRLGKIESAV